MPSSTSSDPPVSWVSVDGEKAVQSNTVPSKKGLEFWLIFASLCTCLFLSALEACAVPTALPTIANALNASQFTWVGTVYVLSAAVFHPMSGDMAQAYGQRPALLITIGLFALGLGGGGIQTLTSIILADLVTLQERGIYAGLYWLISCLATAIGPVIGGSLATQGQWRWLFYLNLPFSLVAYVSVIFLLDLPTPPGNSQDKFMRMDWIGNFLVISSTVAYTIGLTWGGITSPWGSATVLVPLVLGLVGLVFMLYEATLAKRPIVGASMYLGPNYISCCSHWVPFSLMTNLTSISGYIQTFCITVITIAVTYFCPVYYQACKGASPVTSGIYALAFGSFAPSALITGLSVEATRRYRPQIWVGWIILLIGFGLMSTVLATDSLGKSVGYFVMLSLGAGILNATPPYPIQAPLPVRQNAPALALMWFLSSFGGVWGVTIGGTVLQNELAKKLPASFIQSVPQGTAIMYALIPELSTLSPQTRLEVQVAFAESLGVLWQVLIGVSAIGFVASLFMRGLPLPNLLDSEWTMKDEQEDQSIL